MKYFYNNQWNEIGIKALDSMPIGSIILFAGENIPTGWLICDGSEVGYTVTPGHAGYYDLYQVIGTKYGAGEEVLGSVRFKLPDLRGKVPVGLKSTDTDFDTLGETGGSKELQAHNHGGATGGSTAYDTSDIYTTGGSTNFYAITWGGSKVGSDESYKSKTSHSHTIATDGTGNSGNLQPYLVVNYIIKATNTTPTFASVVNATNNSTTDAYSCNYVNNLHNGTLLWTNSDLTSDFNAQTIQLSLSDYDLFEIWFVHDKYTTTYYNVNKLLKGSGQLVQINCGTTSGAEVADRGVTISDSGVAFADCYYRNSVSGNVVTANLRNIPYKIIGYK